MANLGRVYVDLIARTAQFQAGMTRAQGLMAGFQRGANAMIGSLATRLAPAAAAAFAFNELKGAAENIERVSKASAKLGLSAMDYQVLAKAAEETGTSVDAVAGAMQRSVRAIGQAKLSGKPGAFGELGLDPEALSKMSRMEAFRVIIDRLSGVKNEFDRAAVAQEIFGRGAGELSALINGGSAALDEYQRGLASTGQAIDAVGEAQTRVFFDEMERTKGSIKGWWAEVWNYISPAATRMIIKWQIVGTAFQMVASGIGAAVMKMAEVFLRGLATIERGMALIMPTEGLRKMVGAAADQLDEWRKTAGATSEDLWGDMKKNADKVNELWNKAINPVDALNEKIKELGNQRGGAGKGGFDIEAAAKFKAHPTEFKQVSSLASLAQLGTASLNRIQGKTPVEWGRGEKLLEEIAENTAGAQAVLA